MPPTILYLDSSALVKLVVREAESDALFDFVKGFSRLASSLLSVVEVHRAVRRLPEEYSAARARAVRVLAGIERVQLSIGIVGAAAELDPPLLRTLDAIQLASALALRGEIAGMVVYDRRLTDAAKDAGLTVFAPA